MTNTTPEAEAVARAINATEYKYFGDYEMSEDQRDAVDVLVEFARRHIDALPKPEAPNSARVAELEADNDRLRKALEPFAAMGRVIETRARITFGKIPKDSDIICESSGEAGMGILTMGHFRDAATLLPDAPGWGGIYKPLARIALAGKEQP